MQFVQVLLQGHESWNLNLDWPVHKAYPCLRFVQPTLLFQEVWENGREKNT